MHDNYTTIPPDAPITPGELQRLRELSATPDVAYTPSVVLALIDEIQRLRDVLEEDAEAVGTDDDEGADPYPDWTLDEPETSA